MSKIFQEAGRLDEAARAARVLSGGLVIFHQMIETFDLLEEAHTMIAEAFAPHDPLTAHEEFSSHEFGARAKMLAAEYEKSPEIAARFAAMLEALGVDPAITYRDRLRLRVQPPEGTYRSRQIQNLAAHRDSWGSGILAQVNWWAPIHPVSAQCTMVIYPDYFERPIGNRSAEWDFDELRAKLKAGDDSYPLLPELVEPVDEAGAWPVLIAPGDVLCFAAAHLHGSVANETALTRYSTEVRTVGMGDLAAGRAAPNVDGETPRISYDWFSNVADATMLGEAKRLGEDGDEGEWQC
jgi:hypothetical protein